MAALSSYLQVSSWCSFSLISGELKLFFTAEQVFQRPVWIFTKTLKKWWEAFLLLLLLLCQWGQIYQKITTLCSFKWNPPCKSVAGMSGWFFYGGGVGGGDLWQCVCCLKRLRQHQWSMRQPTCPPWEVVSHFCCFILLLLLQGHREQGQVCSSAGFLQQQPPLTPTQQPSRKPPKSPEPSISPVSTAC